MPIPRDLGRSVLPEVGGMLLVDAEARQDHAEMARTLLDDLLDTPLHGPEFQAEVARLSRLGEGPMQQAGDSVDRLLQRSAAPSPGSPTDPATRARTALAELREVVAELDPQRYDLTGSKRTLRFLPGGGVQRYLQRYADAQEQLKAITQTLQGDQDELRQHNAAIQTESDALWQALGRLAEVAVLARHLGDGVEQRIAALRTRGQGDDAATLESDVLFAVRRRHQDLITQLAIAVQGHLALDVVRKTNLELIEGVDRALDTTVVTSGLVRARGTAIQRQASRATVDPEELQQGFDDVSRAMDEIDRHTTRATRSMMQTMTVLEGQVRGTRPQPGRSRSSDAAATHVGRS